MRTLILVRHAKSAWDDPGAADHDRPLAKRGREAAPRVGRWLAERGAVPERVVSSTALRTRETVALMRRGAVGLPEPILDGRLYHAGPETMAAVLAEQPMAASRIMLVGHEPGLSAFAAWLARPPVAPDCARAFEKFPTGAAAVFEADVPDWSPAPGSWRFAALALPRELSG